MQQSVQSSQCLWKTGEGNDLSGAVVAVTLKSYGQYTGIENWEHSLVSSLSGEGKKLCLSVYVASQKKGIDLYVLQKVVLQCRKAQTDNTQKSTPRLCYVLVLLSLLPQTFLHFILIIGYAAKIVLGCDSISLKMFPAL